LRTSSASTRTPRPRGWACRARPSRASSRPPAARWRRLSFTAGPCASAEDRWPSSASAASAATRAGTSGRSRSARVARRAAPPAGQTPFGGRTPPPGAGPPGAQVPRAEASRAASRQAAPGRPFGVDPGGVEEGRATRRGFRPQRAEAE
jgi:hypothetical protein